VRRVYAAGMTPHEFIKKWTAVDLTERAAAQEHFIDLCHLFDHPTPAEDDPKSERLHIREGPHEPDRP
jgi:hypothetical protein